MELKQNQRIPKAEPIFVYVDFIDALERIYVVNRNVGSIFGTFWFCFGSM